MKKYVLFSGLLIGVLIVGIFASYLMNLHNESRISDNERGTFVAPHNETENNKIEGNEINIKEIQNENISAIKDTYGTNEELPQMNIRKIMGSVFKGNVSLATEIPKVPSEMIVYKVKKEKDSKNYPKMKETLVKLAKKINITGNITEDENEFHYIANGRFEISINKVHGKLYYKDTSRMYGKDTNSNYPSRDEARKIAEKFLKDIGLKTDDVHFNRILVASTFRTYIDPKTQKVLEKERISQMIVDFQRKIDEFPVTEGVGVFIGGNGNVIAVYDSRKKYEEWKKFKIISPEEALEILMNGEILITGNPEEAKIKKIDLRYYSGTSSDELNYLQPVYAFYVEFEPKEYEGEEGEWYYIPAIPQTRNNLTIGTNL